MVLSIISVYPVGDVREPHCAKSARIKSFFGPWYLAEKYGVSLHIQSECGKIQTRKTPNTDIFYAVSVSGPIKLVMPTFHQFVKRALESPVTIEQIGNSSFFWLRRISKFLQKISNSSWIELGKR